LLSDSWSWEAWGFAANAQETFSYFSDGSVRNDYSRHDIGIDFDYDVTSTGYAIRYADTSLVQSWTESSGSAVNMSVTPLSDGSYEDVTDTWLDGADHWHYIEDHHPNGAWETYVNDDFGDKTTHTETPDGSWTTRWENGTGWWDQVVYDAATGQTTETWSGQT
jgi:hypothetical protein